MLKIQKNLSNSFLSLLSFPATAVGFALSTQIAALSWLLSTRFGLDIHEVALVWLAGPMAGIIGQPIVGAISDDVWFLGGRRKPFIIIGGILGALMFLALPNIGIINATLGFENIIIIAIIVALMLDLSINITFNPARSIIADLTPEGKKRTSGYTLMQLISGTFGLLAYFISLILGNDLLINIAIILVFTFSIIPCFFIEENKNMELEKNQIKEKTSFLQIIKIIYPLIGFLIFGLYIIITKIFVHYLEVYQVDVMYLCIGITILLGIFVILKGFKNASNQNEFHKIMVAHSFSWLGIQSMFVMSFFFAKDVIVPNLNGQIPIANYFTYYFTNKMPSLEDSAGNILSLAFLLFNFIGAFFPVLVLEPISKKIGRVKTYTISILIMAIAYLFIWKFATSEVNFYAGICLAGIGWSAVISIVFAIMTERVNKSKMGLYMGLFNYSVVLPQMMTVGVAEIVKNSNDHSILYLICGLSLFLSFIFWCFVREPEK